MNQKQLPRNRSAFTLIELLVVISIIALLLGILLPVLGSARKSGRALASASNLRQWGLGSAMFTTDNKTFLPWDGEDQPGNASGSTNPSENLVWKVKDWYANAIPPYLNYDGFKDGTSDLARPGSGSIQVDPGAEVPPNFDANYTIAGVNGVTKAFYFCYVINSKLDEDDSLAAGSPRPVVKDGIKRMKEPMIFNPSATVFMTEKRSVVGELQPYGGSGDGYYTRDLNRVKADWQRLGARYNGGHLAYGDGHVALAEYIDATTPRDTPRVQGVRVDDARVMNRNDRIWSPLQWQAGLR